MAKRYELVLKTDDSSGYYLTALSLNFSGNDCVDQLVQNYTKDKDANIFICLLSDALHQSTPLRHETLLANGFYGQQTQNNDLIFNDDKHVEDYILELEEKIKKLEEENYKLSQDNNKKEDGRLKSEITELKNKYNNIIADKKYVDSENKKLKNSEEHLRSQISENRNEIDSLRSQNKLLEKSNKQDHQNSVKYENISNRWRQLFPEFQSLDALANYINDQAKQIKLIKSDQEKFLKSKQDSEQRLQATEQELQDFQHKLALATSRLRGMNTHAELGGGGSRSEQLKNEFTHLKAGLLHEASSKVLHGWREQGASLTFRSEEFSKIKSILSKRVFGDGTAYFLKDKTAVDSDLHFMMNELVSIKGFTPSVAIFQEIQEKIQLGLQRSRGIDHSEETLAKHREKTILEIDRDLKSVAHYSTTPDALVAINDFLNTGIKLVREIVNDASSGELFIPETGIPFDGDAHNTKDEYPCQIKMTICAGYRVKGTILVKADVMAHNVELDSQIEQDRKPKGDGPDTPDGGAKAIQQHVDVNPEVEIDKIPQLPTKQCESAVPPLSSFEDHSALNAECFTTEKVQKSSSHIEGEPLSGSLPMEDTGEANEAP